MAAPNSIQLNKSASIFISKIVTPQPDKKIEAEVKNADEHHSKAHHVVLDNTQINRRDKIVAKNKLYTLLPRFYNPKDPKDKPIQFTIPELHEFLKRELEKCDIIKGSPILIGGAASNVMAKLEYVDVDICYYIKKASTTAFDLILKSMQKSIEEKLIKKFHFKQIQYSDIYNYYLKKPGKAEFDFILEVFRKFVEQKLKKAFNSEEERVRYLDDNYLYKKIVKEGIAYIGLGEADFKFILDNFECLNSFSASGGWCIPLFTGKDIAYCIDGLTPCDEKASCDALQQLFWRILKINHPKIIDDLAWRVTHRKTQGFKVDSEIELSEIAFDQLLAKFSYKEPAQANKEYGPLNKFQEKIIRHQDNHYPNNPIGMMIDILNFLTFLQARISTDKDSKAEPRDAYFKLIASAWLVRKNPLLNSFMTLIFKNPSNTCNLLALVKGLFFLAWTRSDTSLSAYSFDFSENEHTPRLHIGVQNKSGANHYLAIHGSPVELTKQLMTSWLQLEQHYAKTEDYNTFVKVAKELDIDCSDLSRESRLAAYKEVIKAFLLPRITTVLTHQYKGKIEPTAIFDLLLKEKIQGARAEYINLQKTQLLLTHSLADFGKKDPSIRYLMTSLYDYLNNMDEPPNLKILEKIFSSLETIHEEKTIALITKNPSLQNVLNDTLIRILNHAADHPSTGSMLKQSVLQITLLAAEMDFFYADRSRQAAALVLQSSKSDLLEQSPALLAKTYQFIRKVEKWQLKEERKKVLKQLMTDNLSILFQKAMFASQISLKMMNGTQDEEVTSQCLSIALIAPRNPQQDADITNCCMQFIEKAMRAKNAFTMQLAYTLIDRLVKNQIPLNFKQYCLILELGIRLEKVTEKQVQKENDCKEFHSLGLKLQIFVANKVKELQLQIQIHLLKSIAACFTAQGDFTESKKNYTFYAKAFASLKCVQEKWSKEAEQLLDLTQLDFRKSISKVLQTFITTTGSIDKNTAATLILNDQIRTQMDLKDYEAAALCMVFQESDVKEEEELSQRFSLWKITSLSKAHPKDQHWIKRVKNSLALLNALYTSQSYSMTSKVREVAETIAQALERSVKESADWNAKAIEQLGTPLADIITTLLKDISNKSAEESARQLHSSAHRAALISKEDFNAIFLQILKRDIPSGVLQDQMKYFLDSFFEQSQKQIPYAKILSEVTCELLLSSLKGEGHFDEITGPLIDRLIHHRQLGILTTEVRTALFAFLVNAKKFDICKTLWNELQQIQLDKQEWLTICSILCKAEDPLYLSLVQGRFVSTGSKDLVLCKLILEKCARHSDRKQLEWILVEILEKKILSANEWPEEERTSAYSYIFQYFSDLCVKNPEIINWESCIQLMEFLLKEVQSLLSSSKKLQMKMLLLNVYICSNLPEYHIKACYELINNQSNDEYLSSTIHLIERYIALYAKESSSELFASFNTLLSRINLSNHPETDRVILKCIRELQFGEIAYSQYTANNMLNVFLKTKISRHQQEKQFDYKGMTTQNKNSSYSSKQELQETHNALQHSYEWVCFQENAGALENLDALAKQSGVMKGNMHTEIGKNLLAKHFDNIQKLLFDNAKKLKITIQQTSYLLHLFAETHPELAKKIIRLLIQKTVQMLNDPADDISSILLQSMKFNFYTSSDGQKELLLILLDTHQSLMERTDLESLRMITDIAVETLNKESLVKFRTALTKRAIQLHAAIISKARPDNVKEFKIHLDRVKKFLEESHGQGALNALLRDHLVLVFKNAAACQTHCWFKELGEILATADKVGLFPIEILKAQYKPDDLSPEAVIRHIRIKLACGLVASLTRDSDSSTIAAALSEIQSLLEIVDFVNLSMVEITFILETNLQINDMLLLKTFSGENLNNMDYSIFLKWIFDVFDRKICEKMTARAMIVHVFTIFHRLSKIPFVLNELIEFIYTFRKMGNVDEAVTLAETFAYIRKDKNAIGVLNTINSMHSFEDVAPFIKYDLSLDLFGNALQFKGDREVSAKLSINFINQSYRFLLEFVDAFTANKLFQTVYLDKKEQWLPQECIKFFLGLEKYLKLMVLPPALKDLFGSLMKIIQQNAPSIAEDVFLMSTHLNASLEKTERIDSKKDDKEDKKK